MKRSADTTLITSITALFFTHNNKTQMFDCICGGKAYDENKLLYVHEYFGHNLKTQQKAEICIETTFFPMRLTCACIIWLIGSFSYLALLRLRHWPSSSLVQFHFVYTTTRILFPYSLFPTPIETFAKDTGNRGTRSMVIVVFSMKNLCTLPLSAST